VIRKILAEASKGVKGIVHCSGGAQTKVLHFMNEGLHVIKDDLFELPELFKLIHAQSHTDYREMYKVFNMGHRMELYVDAASAAEIIAISKSFNIDAKIIGHVEAGTGKAVTVKSPYGEFKYEG
jgi:phosphoribosylformylglycinamidine cyclo-ligase